MSTPPAHAGFYWVKMLENDTWHPAYWSGQQWFWRFYSSRGQQALAVYPAVVGQAITPPGANPVGLK